MNTSSVGRHAETGPGSARPAAWTMAWAAFLILVVVAIVAGVYLRPYLENPRRLPQGVDTPGYVFRSQLVSQDGLNALTGLGERPAHPIVTSVLRDVTGGEGLDLARVWPAIFAVAMGLAAAALGAGVAEERRWVGAALGVGLAASPFVALTAIGYASNLFLDVLAVAAVAVAVRIRSGGRGTVALALLLGAAAIAHWLFAILIVLLLVVYAAGVAVATWLRRRSGVDWRHVRRLALGVGLGALLGLLLVLASPERPDKIPSSRQKAAGKIATRLPTMALGVTIPLAAVGGAVMWTSRRPPTRGVLPPLALWALAAPAGLIAWKVFDMTIPHRIVPFALGVPFLIVLGASATRSWTDAMSSRPERRTWVLVGAVASSVLVVASASWLAIRGADTFSEPRTAFRPEQLEQAAILAAYLETTPPGTPVVIPMTSAVWRPVYALMITLPPDRYLDVRPWRKSFLGDRTRFLERLRTRFPDGAVAAYLAGYANQPGLGGTRLGPGVALIAGPRPGTAAIVGVPTLGPAGELVRLTLTSVATLLLVGLGWAILLTGFPAFAAVCIAPAIGTAMLAFGGFVAGRLGFPLGQGGGVIVAVAIGMAGWVGAFVLSRRSPPAVEPETAIASPAPVLAREGGRHLAGERGVRSE
ncbi:MAG TPA: hypothetical protein VFZ75_10125 [Actinomycetota bacterium]|nr:hypothetical protein [Actinomycetota bacterium]